MALNSSGPISLGGSTAGQSINLELSQSATAQVSLNDTNVRSLAGVASGAISMPADFWNKSVGLVVNYLIVGGGGGGGTSTAGGGGGAGGVYAGTATVPLTSYSIVVGSGGAASADGSGSSFNSLTAAGGQAGFTVGAYQGARGGSSGAPQSYAGGAAVGGSYNERGGGGGGAGGIGGDYTESGGGVGGPGYTSSITGTSLTFAGGAGGGAVWSYTAGLGTDGGGNGSHTGGFYSAPTNGSTWGAGGGGGGPGGIGADGAVVISYDSALPVFTGGALASYSGGTSGTIWVHTFTSSGSLVYYSDAYQVTLTGVSPSGLPADINRYVTACDRNVLNTTKPTTTSYICATGDGYANFYRSQDRGNTWSLVRSGSYSHYLSSMDGKAQSSSTSTFCAIVNDTTVGARTMILYRSTDSGSSWGAVSLPAFNKDTSQAGICANQYPGSTEWLAVIGPTVTNDTTAYVIRSTDSGASWSSVGTITTTTARSDLGSVYIACSNDATNASRWMVCIEGDGVWSSTNSGTSWTRVLAATRFWQYGSLAYGGGTWITCEYVQGTNPSTMGFRYSQDNGSTWTFVQWPDAGSVSYLYRNLVNYVEDYVSGGGYFAFSAAASSGGNNYTAVFISTTGASITNTPSFSGTWGPTYFAFQAAVASYGPMIGVSNPNRYCIIPT